MESHNGASLEELRNRLREAEDTLSAIRGGEVDAVVVTGDDGVSRIYTLRGADWTYRLVIEQMQEGAIIMAADGTILYANRRLAEMVGRPLESISGRSVYEALMTPTSDALDDLLLRGRSGPLRIETSLRTAAGELPVRLASNPLAEDLSGALCVVVTDLTTERQNLALVRAQGMLRHATMRAEADAAQLHAVLASISDGLATADAQGDIVAINAAGLRLLGFSTIEDLQGARRDGALQLLKPDGDQLEDADWPARRAARGERLAGVELRVLRPGSGLDRIFRFNAGPVLDERGRVVLGVVTFQDVTEQKNAEAALERLVQERTAELERAAARLRMNERMASIGTLSAGLGHDMGNLLMPIRMRLESLAGEELSADARADIEAIQTAADYLRRLTMGLRMLAADPDRVATSKSVSLHQWWLDAEAVLRNSLPAGVRLEADIGRASLPNAAISPERLTQIVFNLVQNAGDAMRARGSGRVVVRFESPSDGRVDICVEDDGPGMPPEISQRCFEPFFTTKSRAMSTGMGLALVHGLARGAGGAIEVDSEVGRGSIFRVSLPALPVVQPGAVRDTSAAGVASV